MLFHLVSRPGRGGVSCNQALLPSGKCMHVYIYIYIYIWTMRLSTMLCVALSLLSCHIRHQHFRLALKP